MALVSSIIIMTTLNSCDRKHNINNSFADQEIVVEEQDELKDVSKIYKDTFFTVLPLLSAEPYNKEFLQKTFDWYNVDIDFESAYVFLNNYYRQVVDMYHEAASDHIYDNITIEKKDECSYDANYLFNYDDKYFAMNIYKYNNISNYYEYVIEDCESKANKFIKKYFYKTDILPGDKNKDKNVASIEMIYEIRLNDGKDYINVIAENMSEIKKKQDKIKTISNNKYVFFYKNGYLINEKELNDNEFNKLVNNIYYIYHNNMNLNEVLNSEEKENKWVLKLIKN